MYHSHCGWSNQHATAKSCNLIYIAQDEKKLKYQLQEVHLLPANFTKTASFWTDLYCLYTIMWQIKISTLNGFTYLYFFEFFTKGILDCQEKKKKINSL